MKNIFTAKKKDEKQKVTEEMAIVVSAIQEEQAKVQRLQEANKLVAIELELDEKDKETVKRAKRLSKALSEAEERLQEAQARKQALETQLSELKTLEEEQHVQDLLKADGDELEKGFRSTLLQKKLYNMRNEIEKGSNYVGGANNLRDYAGIKIGGIPHSNPLRKMLDEETAQRKAKVEKELEAIEEAIRSFLQG